MEITKNYNGNELTLAIKGNVDTITSQELDEEIQEEIGKFDSLTLDFTDLEYISSGGLRVLIATQKKLKPDNIPFVITNVNDNVSDIFRMSGFDKILKIE